MKLFLRIIAFFLLMTSVAATTYGQVPTVTAQVGFPLGTTGKAVVYGNAKYLLLGAYNADAAVNPLYVSTNGTAWSAVTASGLTDKQLSKIAFGNNLFVAAGYNGVIQTSPDGITWTTRTSNTTNRLLGISFVNNKFFAFGDNRTLITSADGITWTTVTFNSGVATDYFNSFSFGNGVYILAGRNSTIGSTQGAVVYRSTTAANNSFTYTNSAFAVGTTLNRIQFLNNKFFAFTSGFVMYNSTDGATWTNFTSSVVLTQPDNSTRSWGSGHQIFNGVWDGTKYHFYGSSAYYSGYGSTFTSTNGTNFTLLNKTAYIVPQESIFLNGMYFICGNEGVVSSSDGLTYKYPGFQREGMVKTAGKYISVGTIGNSGQVGNSVDFDTWTDRTPAGQKVLYAIATDGTTVLAAGVSDVIRSTNDGDSWTTVYSNATETMSALAYGSGKFVVAGYNTSNQSYLRYSVNNGQTWASASTLNNYYFKIKFVNNRFFAFGYNNVSYLPVLLTSTDCISWSDVTPPTSYEVYYYKDIAFDGSKYHLLGMQTNNSVPVGMFTLSTATPTVASSYTNKAVVSNAPAGVVLGGTWDEGVLEYANGVFTGAVIDTKTGQDYIITSTNGNSWSAYPQNSYSSITSVVVNGNQLKFASRGNALFSVTNGSVLPVTMVQMKGYMQHASAIVNWQTASQQHVQQFEVQRSANGTQWSHVGTVAATQQIDGSHYSFTDNQPLPGKNYYRLLVRDADGKATFSQVVMVLNGSSNGISIYPNPARSVVIVRTAGVQRGTVTLRNTAGQPVRNATINGFETAISVADLPAGVYLAEVWQQGSRYTLPVILK